MRVVIVEDQNLFSEFLYDLIKNDLKHDIVGQADNGQDGLQVILKEKPDLVILDILIPKLSGIHVAEEVKSKLPNTKILALSSESDDKTLYQIDKLDLSGFLDKNSISIEKVTQAILSVTKGETYFSRSIQKSLIRIKEDPKSFLKILTRREHEVLTYIGGGLSDDEIGNILGLSPISAKSHRKNLFRKLNVHSTPELIKFAQDNGYWKPSFNKMNLTDSYHIHF